MSEVRKNTASLRKIDSKKKDVSILLVDPNNDSREDIYNFLLTSGFDKVQQVDNITEAFYKATTNFFDIILVDLFMPEKSGLHLARQIQKQTKRTKIILLVDGKYQPILNGAGAKIRLPSILKSFVTRDLVGLLLKD